MKHYDYMKGYKATNADMTCRGFKFELGKWYKHEGEIKQCESGFHFCVHPSGPWSYYNDKGTRLFAVEARDVIEEYTPGSDLKVVCHEIRLLSEIIPDGGRNTGYMNTGNRNTGDGNTGDGNATNHSAGFFCVKEPKVVSFDKQTKFTHKKFQDKYPEASHLGERLLSDAPFDYKEFSKLPGWTLKKCKALHQRFIDGRRLKK